MTSQHRHDMHRQQEPVDGSTVPSGIWNLSKLSAKVWEEIGERYRAGETSKVLSAEYGISAAAIRQRFSHR